MLTRAHASLTRNDHVSKSRFMAACTAKVWRRTRYHISFVDIPDAQLCTQSGNRAVLNQLFEASEEFVAPFAPPYDVASLDSQSDHGATAFCAIHGALLLRMRFAGYNSSLYAIASRRGRFSSPHKVEFDAATSQTTATPPRSSSSMMLEQDLHRSVIASPRADGRLAPPTSKQGRWLHL
jgi:hypothetical protein